MKSTAGKLALMALLFSAYGESAEAKITLRTGPKCDPANAESCAQWPGSKCMGTALLRSRPTRFMCIFDPLIKEGQPCSPDYKPGKQCEEGLSCQEVSQADTSSKVYQCAKASK